MIYKAEGLPLALLALLAATPLLRVGAEAQGGQPYLPPPGGQQPQPQPQPSNQAAVAPQPQQPANTGAASAPRPLQSHGGGHPDEWAGDPVNYEFSYEVQDPQYGVDFGHREMRQDDQATGSYHVLLPDGRTQIVDYVADGGGYRPMIRYEGTASFPPSPPQQQQQQPVGPAAPPEGYKYRK